MTVRQQTLRAEAVHFVPEALLPGILYVSEAFETAIHLCACGCGCETVTPLDEGGWKLTDGPTLRPSIGNYGVPCSAHYYVTDGRVEWL